MCRYRKKWLDRDGWLYFFLRDSIDKYRLARFQASWRKDNQHNSTMVKNIFPADKVSVGSWTYGDIHVYGYNCNEASLKIGSFCSIAGNVEFYIGGEHALNSLMTYPLAVKVYGIETKNVDSTKGPIIVEDDVWIGAHSVILSGVTLSQGCVIGAGSIVAKSVPPYAIYAGGRVIRYRFLPEIIAKLQRIKIGELSADAIARFRAYCTVEISNDTVDDIIRELMEGSLK